MKRAGLLVVLAFVVGGCGGSSEPATPSSVMRANGPGDSWNYAVTITFGSFGTYNGTLSEALTSDTYNSNPSIKDTRSFTIQSPTGPQSLVSYTESSLTGTLLAETVNGTPVAVTNDGFAAPKSYSSDTSVSGTVTLASGETIQETYKVVGAQYVGVPAGLFACWVVSENVTRSDGSSDTFMLYIPPEVGNYVKLTDTTSLGDGTGYSYTAEMTSQTTRGVLRGDQHTVAINDHSLLNLP